MRLLMDRCLLSGLVLNDSRAIGTTEGDFRNARRNLDTRIALAFGDGPC